MADYRSWCGTCGNEISFGSHKPDCEWEKSVYQAKKDKEEWESDRRAEIESWSEDEAYDILMELHNSIIFHASELHRLERTFEFTRYELGYRQREAFKRYNDRNKVK